MEASDKDEEDINLVAGEFATPSGKPAKRVLHVVLMDQKEHPLIAGLWVGLGVVQKVVEIRVKVSDVVGVMFALLIDSWIHRENWCISPLFVPSVPKGKVCSGLDGHPCGQCMCDRKTCWEVVIESKSLVCSTGFLLLTLMLQMKFQSHGNITVSRS